MSNVPKYSKLFFLHIPKTAGTSIVDTLREIFGEKNSLNYIEGLTKIDQIKTADYDFVSGHLFYDEIQELGVFRDFDLITVLRNPYQRLASHLRYMDRYNQPEYEAQLRVLSPDLQDVVAALNQIDFTDALALDRFLMRLNPWSRIAFDNSQVRFLVDDPGSTHQSRFPILDDRALDLAIQRLAHFKWIGRSEDLSSVIGSIAKERGVSPPDVRRSNVNDCRRTIDTNNRDIRRVLEPYVRLDRLLVESVVQQFRPAGLPGILPRLLNSSSGRARH